MRLEKKMKNDIKAVNREIFSEADVKMGYVRFLNR